MLSPGTREGPNKWGLSLVLLLDLCQHSHTLSQETQVLGPALPLAQCDCGQVPTPLAPSFLLCKMKALQGAFSV